MISTVETTHIGARSPGPDTEVGICSDALQKEMNIIKTLFRFQFQELMKLYQFWKGIENIWNILFFHNSINKRSFNLELNFLARCLRREVDPLNKMVVGVSWRGGAVGQKDQFLPQMPSTPVCLMSPYNRTRPNLSSGTSPYPRPKQIMNPVCLVISQVLCQNDLTCERGNKTIDQSHSGWIKLLQGGN